MTTLPEQIIVEGPSTAESTIVIKTVGPVEFARLFTNTFQETVVQKIAAAATAAEMGDKEYATKLQKLAQQQIRALELLLGQAMQDPSGTIEVPISNKYPRTPIIALDQLGTPTNNH